MSTTVTLRVTPQVPVDPHDGADDALPAEVADLLRSHGQRTAHGFSRTCGQPWRWSFHLSGRDRTEAGLALQAALRRLGHDADLLITR